MIMCYKLNKLGNKNEQFYLQHRYFIKSMNILNLHYHLFKYIEKYKITLIFLFNMEIIT